MEKVSYKKLLRELVSDCKKHGITVKFVCGRGELRDYAGMNPEAAESMGFSYKGKKLTDGHIIIDSSLPIKTQYKNLKHEVVEYNDMSDKNMKYWPSHLDALKGEKSDSLPKDFPVW